MDTNGSRNGVASQRTSDSLSSSEYATLCGLERLAPAVGVEFWTTRIEIAYEAGLTPSTIDYAVYSLRRRGFIEHVTSPGRGTRVRVLRTAA